MAEPTNQNNTLSYDESVAGWPSFYSYVPDWMIGMNNYFYTFNEGNLYRHNVNEVRNNYYGVQYSSTLKSIFNQSPLENKLFKTINLEGDNVWDVTISTDIQDSGYIEKEWFVKKEGAWFSFIRNSGTTPAGIAQYALRSLNGIGNSQAVSAVVNDIVTIDFSLSIDLGNIVSVGDMLYFTNSGNPLLAGQITEVNVNLRSGINQFKVDTNIVGTTNITLQVNYFLYIKNSIAESHGVLGHYGVFDLTNDNTNKIELFAVESEVMKSFP
mgnify:FL=1|tara:strand:- start:682 stop:1488 length:807 start_codon:yes stop_codon:yes gene_type:complete